MTEDEMVGCHHWLNGHEFEQTPGDSEGQGYQYPVVHGVTKSQTQLRDWTTILQMTENNKIFFRIKGTKLEDLH